MKPHPFDYYCPRTLDEAVEIKAKFGSEAACLAGGQSLIPMLNFRVALPPVIIDLNAILSLQYIERRDGGFAIGAMTRQHAVERHDGIAHHCPLLKEGVSQVGHAPIRNRGTIGGSIAHADPAAELPTALVALGGHVTAVGPAGARRIEASDFFVFPLTTALDEDEILTEVFLHELPNHAGSAFVEFSRRHGDFALAGVAAVCNGERTRLVLSGVGPHPIAVETDDPVAAADCADPVDDLHGTADYRRQLVRVLVRQAVGLARERARGEELIGQ